MGNLRMVLADSVEVSAILGPGVYALAKRGIVIYVGKSKAVYQRVYTHRTAAKRAARGQAIPTWLPIKGFVFDQVFVWPCRLEDLDRLEAEKINLYKPRYNQSLKQPGKVTAPVVVNVLGVPIPLNHRVVEEGLRRV